MRNMTDTPAAPTPPARLAPGDAAPPLELTADDGSAITLADYAGRRVLVYFYPKANTPGCTGESCDFRDNLARLNTLGIDVIGVSPDSPDALAAFRAEHGLNFALASDPERTTMAAWGAFGEKKNYGRVVRGVIRSTVLVGADGVVEAAWYNVRAKGHVDRILRDVADA